MALTIVVSRMINLYTQPEHVAYAYTELSKVGRLFGVAAAFGNVHGVYSPGNVELRPVILKNSQDYIQKELKTKPKPVYFVFHGGSGSPQIRFVKPSDMARSR